MDHRGIPRCIFPSIFQHTPDLSQPFMKEFFSFGGLAMPGVCETRVCWGSLRIYKGISKSLIVGVSRWWFQFYGKKQGTISLYIFPGSFNSSPLKNYNPKKKGLSSNYRIQLETPKET